MRTSPSLPPGRCAGTTNGPRIDSLRREFSHPPPGPHRFQLESTRSPRVAGVPRGAVARQDAVHAPRSGSGSSRAPGPGRARPSRCRPSRRPSRTSDVAECDRAVPHEDASLKSGKERGRPPRRRTSLSREVLVELAADRIARRGIGKPARPRRTMRASSPADGAAHSGSRARLRPTGSIGDRAASRSRDSHALESLARRPQQTLVESLTSSITSLPPYFFIASHARARGLLMHSSARADVAYSKPLDLAQHEGRGCPAGSTLTRPSDRQR